MGLGFWKDIHEDVIGFSFTSDICFTVHIVMYSMKQAGPFSGLEREPLQNQFILFLLQ
jgi:hypothetical protein